MLARLGYAKPGLFHLYGGGGAWGGRAHLGRGMICVNRTGGLARLVVFAGLAGFGSGEDPEAEGKECQKGGVSKDSLVSLVWVEESQW